LSHASSPLCSNYIGGKVWCFAQAFLDHDSPILTSHHNWDDKSVATSPRYWLIWVLANSLPGLASNQDPPKLSLLSS
jgi:hypothetical protein